MRVKVRAVEPPVATAGLEEIVAGTTDAGAEAATQPGSSGAGRASEDAKSAATAFRLETHERPIGAADLGPNGDVVFDLLSRAARLTPASAGRWTRRPPGAGGW